MAQTPTDVFGWLADHSGCGQLRIKDPLDALKATGLDTRYDVSMSIRGLMPKVIVGQRVCKDAPSKLWQYVSSMEQRPKLVFEVDDDLWNVDASNPGAFRWFINGIADDGSHHDVHNNLAGNIACADRVTCTTPALAELLSQYNENVYIIPNFVPQWLTEHERPKRDRLTVGWIGSATHTMDWEQASDHFRQFLNRNSHVDFHVIGGIPDDWARLPKDQLITTDWIDGVVQSWKTIDFDIGVAPLRPHIFNRSKSSIKFLEYASLGIPTIASDVGPYADHIQHGVTGYLVKRDHEWTKYLRMLTNDHDMREEMGRNAREWAKTQTMEGNVHLWSRALCQW